MVCGNERERDRKRSQYIGLTSKQSSRGCHRQLLIVVAVVVVVVVVVAVVSFNDNDKAAASEATTTDMPHSCSPLYFTSVGRPTERTR